MDNFDLVLDECLNQISSGASTLDECLARHPNYAAQLKPLLQTASRFERGRDVRPSPAFKARARARLALHMQAHPRRKPLFAPFLRVAFSMAVVVLMFLTAGTALAQSALPGDALYQWKLTGELVWRATASDPLAVDLALSERRVDEMLAVSGDAAAYASALDGYLEVINCLTVYTDVESQARILPILQSQQERLAQGGLSIPELDTRLAPTPLPVPPVVPELTPELPLPVPTVTIPDLLPDNLP
ncbi:MAG: hypothetical protein HY781_03800 [Chloroflexi bacterium]|nr:hypothetical protein [Chloroflexota bacterium]